MKDTLLSIRTLIFLFGAANTLFAQTGAHYQYYRIGNSEDVAVKAESGFALMGGGKDLDAAFAWMATRARGGDFLVLRASGNDDYNSYVQKLGHLNSVATLIIPSKEAANESFVAATIAKAEAIFIAGGDQANYINFWKGTPVQAALNDAIARGVPIGGTSAGLAVQGEYIYSAQNDPPDGANLSSKMALANPFHPQIVIVHGFLNNPLLVNTITDTHFSARDRLGRLLVFMARIETKPVKAIGVDQGAAVLLDIDGKASVIGKGAAYFLMAATRISGLTPGIAATFGPVSARKVPSGEVFDVLRWTGPGSSYKYYVDHGVIRSTQMGGAIY